MTGQTHYRQDFTLPSIYHSIFISGVCLFLLTYIHSYTYKYTHTHTHIHVNMAYIILLMCATITADLNPSQYTLYLAAVNVTQNIFDPVQVAVIGL